MSGKIMNADAPNLLNQPDFQWQNAVITAELCQLAYHDADTVEQLSARRWGFKHSGTFDADSTHGFIAYDDLVAVIAFRGKDDVGDWLGSNDLETIDTPYGSIVESFYTAWLAVKPNVVNAISSLPSTMRTIWITGHGFGGALATVAALELKDNKKLAGAYTFGQPRVGSSQLQEVIDERYPNSFFRFVNDDDIVARIPPGLVHCGSLFHFGSHGQLSSPSDSATSNVEISSNTEIDFASLKSQIHDLQFASPTSLESIAPYQNSIAAGLEGFIPGVFNHHLSRYIAAIRRHVPNTATAVNSESIRSRGIQAMTRGGLESALAYDVFESSDPVPILLRTIVDNWTPYPDLRVNSRLGTVVTATATPEQIERLKSDPDISSIDISRDAGNVECAVSVPFVNGNLVHVPPLDERGSHVIVGSIDSGIDVLHKAFLDDAGKTRIVAVWNQRDSNGPSPKQVDPGLYTQDFGTLYDHAAIQEFVDGLKVPPLALRDPQLHGTHVASIAAGRQVGNFAGGIAPEAQIALVIPNMKTSPGSPPSIGYSVSHVDALIFLRLFARKQQLPIAINVSLGMNAGAHDGMSNLESSFDIVSSNGKDAGIAIIKSAGNERGFAGHAMIQAMTGGVSTLTWDSLNRFRLQDYIEVWYSGVDELEFALIAPDTPPAKSTTINANNPSYVGMLGGNRCVLELTVNHPDNGDNLLAIHIRPDTANILTGEWKLDVTGLNIFSTNGRVDAWVERDDKARAVSFTSGDNNEMTLSIPGTANSVFTVASCAPANPIRLSANSSFGPTRKLSPKPELAAPGENIKAAMANEDDHQATTVLSGTSMAAPHVTGAIALAFSRRKKNSTLPQVNAQQIRTALLKSLKNRTQNHNLGFGFGILDIDAFLKLIP